jgi:hypothetical protein
MLCVMGLLEGYAQSQDVAKQISNIKRDTTYLYAEATMKDLDEAFVGAKAILEMKVGDWIRGQKANEGVEVCIAKAKDHCFEVQTRRGDYYRAFVYVKKSDIMPVTDKNEVVVFQVAPQEAEKSSANDAISEEAPVESKPGIILTSDEQQMKSITSFYDVEPYIKDLKGKNRLIAYGKYATLPADEDCHLFVYDKQGNISALLRKTGDIQYNLNTLKEDNVKNYKNCGAIWFQLK